MKSIFRVIFKGLVVVVPLGVTLYVLGWLGTSAENLLSPPLQWILPEDGPLRYRTGMGVLVGLILLMFVGLLTYTYIFKKLMSLVDHLLEKVPIVKSLYGGLRDLMDLMSRTQQMAKMNEVVAVEMGDGCRLIGFITQPESDKIPDPLTKGEDRVAVYLPMSYQVGGYTIFVKRDQFETVDMSIEDAMRYALTAGMSTKENKESDSSDDKK